MGLGRYVVDAIVLEGRSPSELMNAVLADHVGDRTDAITHYRRAIDQAAGALTPSTLIRAQVNLAAALEHIDPAEAVALCEHALRCVASEQLNEHIQPGIHNVHAYALLCDGRANDAMSALVDAQAFCGGSVRVGLQLTFNRAVALEMTGDPRGAAESLTVVRDRACAAGFVELASWACLRKAWLLAQGGNCAEARTFLASELERVPISLRDAFDTLDALLLAADGSLGPAARLLSRLVDAYLGKGDELNAFAVLLWLAHVYRAAGRSSIARAALRRAFSIGRRRAFRSSPNWWSDVVVVSARALAEPRDQPYAASLLAVHCAAHAPSHAEPVVVQRDGDIRVAGDPLPTADWRRGKSGPFVMKRVLSALVVCHPQSVPRERLADVLWPASDGDVAIRNLYGAVTDVRQLLMSVPGVRLVSAQRAYKLELDANASIERGARPAALNFEMAEGREPALRELARRS